MTFERLRAKSGDGTHASEFLPEHLADAFRAAQLVLDATADDQFAALGLVDDRHRERMRRLVPVAAAVHDLGKANNHFQEMIRGTRDVRVNPQGLRHEWVALLMLQQLREWLMPALAGSSEDFAILEWSVVGHHPAIDHPSPPTAGLPGAGAEIELLMGHNDFRAALVYLQSLLKLAEPPRFTSAPRSLVGGSNNVFSVIRQWSIRAHKEWDRTKARTERRAW